MSENVEINGFDAYETVIQKAYKCKLYMRKDDDPTIMKSNEGRVNVIRAQMNKHGK